MARAEKFLAKANRQKAFADKLAKGTAAYYKTATTKLAQAKAAARKAVKERDQAIKIAKTKITAARQAR